MYLVSQTVITGKSELYTYFDTNARLAKCLYNAALFRIRQIFTGYDKPESELNTNQLEVRREVELLQKAYPSIKVKRVISYFHLEKLMRVTHNTDFFAGLPMQTAQHILQRAVADFKNWLAGLRKYKKHPEGFLGKPRMPHYKKSDMCTYSTTYQEAKLYPSDNGGSDLKLPLTDIHLHLSNIQPDARLKVVEVKPYYGRFLLLITFEADDVPVNTDMPETAAIDFGTDNIAAIVCTDGSSAIYKGGAILSENRLFAKQRAKYTGIITKGHSRMFATSRRLTDMSYRHANFNRDQCHKISASIIRWCVAHKAGTLVLGVNKYWKQESNMGRVNNQNFVSMPLFILRCQLEYKAALAGITIIEQEESYTSKADITAMNHIPTYGIDDAGADFSGKRIKRGLYRCHNGLIINADCNGAANIMRKALPDIWNGTEDFSFLAAPEVYGFHELNPSSIPKKKGIAAA
jgi:putative transposase